MRVACVCALVISMVAIGPAAASAATPSQSLKALVRQTKGLKLNGATKRTLLASLGIARGKLRHSPCSTLSSLTRFRRQLLKIHFAKTRRGKKIPHNVLVLSSLGPASLKISRTLLASKSTRRCGGGIRNSSVHSTKAKILSSSAKGLTARVTLPDLKFVSRSAGGHTWTQLVLPNTDSPQAPGKPGIPVTSTQFAVPDGATVQVKQGSSTSYTLDGVDVYPSQPDSKDAISAKKPNFLGGQFASAPFKLDPKAYSTDKVTPGVTGGMLGHVRDLAIGNVDVPAVQYDPKAHKVKVFQSVDVKVTFGGKKNTGGFSDYLGSPWEAPARRGLADLLNSSLVGKLVHRDIHWRVCGEQMLVITNPATLAAANTLATARSGVGLRTRVVQTGSAAGQIGTTPAQIQGYIRGELTGFLCIHPSYVAIIGDNDLVPTFTGTGTIDGIPSDLPYSWRDSADELPDVAVGRIIAPDQTVAQTAVDKIVAYEASPPGGVAFLNHATIAADFQDDDADGTENRTFVQFAETVRNGLVRRGVTTDRVYNMAPSTTPLKFNDGTDLPASLKLPTFAWNGTGADVSADWNAGRFLVIHRDHGYSQGWGTPGFTSGDVNALTNGSLLPVVMSVNCASGAYDTDKSSFATTALDRSGGGAVGVFGDTRNSPSWHNTQLALGIVDGLLPSVLPSEGPAGAQRTGDALINGKLRLVGLANPATDGSSRDELYLWHYFGDPSMQMWGGGHQPFVIDPAKILAQFSLAITGPPPGPGPPPYQVNVTLPAELNGQPVSLLRNGEVVGTALVEGGHASVAPLFTGDGSVKPGELKIAIEGDGAVPVSAPVAGVPRVATTLAQVCPTSSTTGSPLTVTGTLTGAPGGSSVTVTFKAPDPVTFVGVGRTVIRTVETNSDGSWTASADPTANEPGTWTVKSAFAGDATYLSSSAGPCSVSVQPPIG
jgi:Peptidase family C25/Propeptide_C25